MRRSHPIWGEEVTIRPPDELARTSQREAHPLNPRVWRGLDGIWGSDELPAMPWEVADARVVLSPKLRAAIGQPESVVRWALEKRALALHSHPRDAAILEDLTQHLHRWSYVGREPDKADTWRVLFQVDERWYATTLGRDIQGSLNIVTAFGSSNTRFLANRLKSLIGLVEREE